jgi:hypothetical protein
MALSEHLRTQCLVYGVHPESYPNVAEIRKAIKRKRRESDEKPRPADPHHAAN